jgi:hypothetical protein
VGEATPPRSSSLSTSGAMLTADIDTKPSSVCYIFTHMYIYMYIDV